MTFVFKNDHEKTNLYTAEEVRISVAHKRIIGRNGQMGVSFERDESSLTIVPVDPQSAIGRGSGGGIAYVARTAAGVRSRLRRLRPEDAKAMEKIDAKVASLEAQIAQLQKQRGQLLQQAWRQAETVEVNVQDVGNTETVLR